MVDVKEVWVPRRDERQKKSGKERKLVAAASATAQLVGSTKWARDETHGSRPAIQPLSH
jgi:hypothetical protein